MHPELNVVQQLFVAKDYWKTAETDKGKYCSSLNKEENSYTGENFSSLCLH